MTTMNESTQSYAERYLQQRTSDAELASKGSEPKPTGSYAERYQQTATYKASDEQDPVATEEQALVDDTAEDDVAETESALPKLQLTARHAQVELSRKIERQLSSNSRELDMLQVNLAATDSQATSICFTSCFNGEGKTTAALSAAYGLTLNGERRVLLIDADINQPRLHKFFASPLHNGLQDLLDGRCSLEQALHPSATLGLDFMSAGEGDGGSLSRSQLGQLLDTVERAYDYVIIDSTSVLTSADASRLAPLFGGLVLVVACEETKWDVVQSAAEKIHSSGGEVLGIALNKRRFHIPKQIYKWLSR